VSPEEAVKIIESGDAVVIPVATEVQALSRALMNRGNELKNVNVLLRMPRCDLGWLGGDVGDAFNVILDTQPASFGAKFMNEKGLDLIPFLYGLRFKGEHDARRRAQDIDVVMIVVSPPDENGLCSFGLYLSHKKDYTSRAKKVLAEVCDSPAMRVRTPGDNYIHISDIDFFVEHIPAPIQEPQQKHDELDKQIAEYVSTVVRDDDTLELGPGLAASLPGLGTFDDNSEPLMTSENSASILPSSAPDSWTSSGGTLSLEGARTFIRVRLLAQASDGLKAKRIFPSSMVIRSSRFGTALMLTTFE